MALQPSIILAGRSPDVVNALAASTQAAQMGLDLRHQQGYRNALAQYGAGAYQGDEAARAQLAAFDPLAMQGMAQTDLGMDATRLNMDATRLNMQATQQQMRILDEENARAAATAMATADAATVQAEIDHLKRVLTGALTATTPQEWDAFVLAQGADELVGQFDNRQRLAAMQMDLADIYEQTFAAPDQSGQFDRFRVVGDTLFDLGAEGGPVPVGEGAGQTETIYGPDGRPIITRGPGSDARPFTEAQSKDIGFAARGRTALETLDMIAPEIMTNRVQRGLDYVPFGLGRELQDPTYQVAQNAGTQFLMAILRKDTGAAITGEEERIYGAAFLPQPGDSPELLEQKRQARELAIAGIEAGLPSDAILAQAMAMGAGQTGPTFLGTITPEGAVPSAAATPQVLTYNPETGMLE